MSTSTDLLHSLDLNAIDLSVLRELHSKHIIDPDYQHRNFPLTYLLLLHYKSCKNEHRWYERIHGFKLLCDWLDPITYTPLTHSPNLSPLTVYMPHELNEMEYYSGISEREIVECTVMSVLPLLNKVD